jgi:S-adenosyl-L-methionine hydrolase (adenosine-forming)
MIPVTLTTDFGTRDYYAGQLKGTLLSFSPEVYIVDISHDIPPFDIVEAAFVFRNAWLGFREGSIHLLHVHNRVDDHREQLYIRHQGHHFIGPNNGLFSLIFEDLPQQLALLQEPGDTSFQTRYMMARAVKNIVQGIPTDKWTTPVGNIERRIQLRPVVYPSRIVGFVVHLDNYENAVTNISVGLFEEVGRGRAFLLRIKGNRPIGKIASHYQDVPVGEAVCLFNGAGLLEIAVNMGKAHTLFGLSLGDPIEIDFQTT